MPIRTNTIVHIAKLQNYDELLDFYNNRGEDLLRSGPLPRLPGAHEDRLFDWKWNKIIVVREVETKRIIGTALVGFRQEFRRLNGHVEFVLVDPEFQGQGVGQTLMGRVHSEARQMGAERMLLKSGLDRPEARTFYLDLGYKLVEGSRVHFILNFE